jgi:beta-lactamase regulating signal transducer with metallopeptidase domain
MMDAGLAIEVAAKGALVLAAVCVLYALMPRGAASQRHLMLAVAMAGVLLIPAFAILLPNVSMPIAAESKATAAPIPAAGTVSVSTGYERPLRAVRAIPANEPIAPVTSSESASISWTTITLGVWAAGFTLTLLPLAIGLLGIRRVRRSGRLITDPEWTDALRAARVGLRVRGPVTLIESPQARVPMTWGVLHNYVALPESAREWPPQRRQVVLCHELAHIKRRDFLTQLIARVACAAHWFNPLSWWALRAMNLERERACDDLVVHSGVRAPDYAEHLLQIVRDTRGVAFTARTAIAMAGHSRLEQRVRSLLDATQNRRALTGGARVMTIGAALGCVAFLAMLQPTAVAHETDDDSSVVETDIVIDEGLDEETRIRVRSGDAHHRDFDKIFEHVSEVLKDVDVEIVIEKALHTLERENVQRHLDHAADELNRVDIQAEIEGAFEDIDSIELSEEDVDKLRGLDRETIRRELRKAQRHLREVDVDAHLDEALKHLDDAGIERHIESALNRVSRMQDSPEWDETMDTLRKKVVEIDFEAIGARLGAKLEEIDVEAMMETARRKVDEIDVDAIADTIQRKIDEVEVIVEARDRAVDDVRLARVDTDSLLRRDDLRGADLRNANLGGKDLSGKDFRGAWMAGADLREANLEGADLRDADLSGANLREANLKDAKLECAELGAANLRGADLTGVSLHGVDLTEADWRGTRINEYRPAP